MLKFDQSRLHRIQHWLQGYVETRRFAGASVLVNQAGQEAFFCHAGQRDVAANLPFTRDTIARIYSMTKPVTSLACMMLAERGLLHLDAPVSDFIPAFGNMKCLIEGATSIDQTQDCPPPSLHQLLTHTSGLSYPFNPGVLSRAMDAEDLMFASGPNALGPMVDRLATLPLAFQPGSRWEYSVGIDVIGRVIEVVSGQSLEEFFVHEILNPLGMKETRFSVPKGQRGRFATLYTPLAGSGFGLNEKSAGGETLRRIDHADGSPYLNSAMQSGGGGLVGTIDDYMKFTEMLRSGGAGLVSPLTLEFMMRNHLRGDIASMGPASFAEQPMEGMGFGIGGAVLLNPARARAPGSVGDFSWGGMASTFFWVDPVLNLSVVFFTQLTPSSSYPARPQLKALIHGALMP